MGSMMMITRKMHIVKTNGQHPRKMVYMGTSLCMPASENTTTPTGGVMQPIMMHSTAITPSCRGSKPISVNMGKKIGSVMIITDQMSIKQPSMKYMTQTSSITMYLLSSASTSALEMAGAISLVVRKWLKYWAPKISSRYHGGDPRRLDQGVPQSLEGDLPVEAG